MTRYEDQPKRFSNFKKQKVSNSMLTGKVQDPVFYTQNHTIKFFLNAAQRQVWQHLRQTEDSKVKRAML